jgi:hypothetical protein
LIDDIAIPNIYATCSSCGTGGGERKGRTAFGEKIRVCFSDGVAE